MKLMSHTIKTWERVLEKRLGDQVKICEQQYGFMPGKKVTGALFALRMQIEKHREEQKELHCAFKDLEKT